ncbi:hypothetical protein VP01_5505g1 [Puccinia sorghi]|uniref:Uncharacterized protein n=1 Tax=Puccinia sorghi TaxID=27349 RepID=A0A0L6UJG7_9BASI|nr:hypothetical protein VP01_5505g1 [Puccinia sorghi]
MAAWLEHTACQLKAVEQKNMGSIKSEHRKMVKENTGLPNQSMIWQQVEFSPHNLYSTTPWVDTKTSRFPSPKEVEEAYNQIKSYWFLHSGINVVCDPLSEDFIIHQGCFNGTCMQVLSLKLFIY